MGLAVGFSLGLYVAIQLIAARFFPPYGQQWIQVMQSLFPFVQASFLGAFVGFWWVFLEVYLVIWLSGTIYNALTQRGYGCARKKIKRQG